MIWNATRILWDEQVMLLWIVLPPIFLGAALLPVAARSLFSAENKRKLSPQKRTTTQGAVERV